ncbi:MAG: hypothetical protein WAL22_15030 [Solirubrobacteraceae bacterium]
MMRFWRVIVVLVIAVVAASAAVAISAASTFGGGAGGPQTPFKPPPATSPKARANRRAARRDARSLLTKLKLPAGATSVPSEPAHDHGYLKPQPLLEEEFASLTAHAWWTVPGDPQSVLNAIEANPPAGATQNGTGRGGNFKTGTSELGVEYQSPPVANVLGSRLLEVTVTSIGPGRTGVLAESQSVWIVPRPASERIPAATRVVQIASAVPGAADDGTVTVMRRGQVGSIVALLNRLPIVQPGVTGCPAQIEGKTITMTFRASSSAPALAVLRFVDYQPWTAASSDQCAPVQLSVAGRVRPALDGGDFIKRIERVIGLNIT